MAHALLTDIASNKRGLDGPARRRRGWRAALFATTALIAVGLIAPDRVAADQTINVDTVAPPSIVEGGLLTVTANLNINNTGVVETQNLLIDGGEINVNTGGTLTVNGQKTTQGTSELYVNAGGTLTAGTVLHQGTGTFLIQGGTSTSQGMTLDAFFRVTGGGSHEAFGAVVITAGQADVQAGSSFVAHETLTLDGNGSFQAIQTGSSITAMKDVNVLGNSRFEAVGAIVEVFGAVNIAGSGGTARVNATVDGVFTAHGAIVVGDNAHLSIGTTGSTINALSTVTVNGTGELRLTGTFNASGPITLNGGQVQGFNPKINGELINVGAMMAPGFNAGVTSTFNIIGVYDQRGGGTFFADLKANGDADRLSVVGTTRLAGAVTVNIVDAGIVAGQQFRIVAADTPITGMFEAAHLTGQPIGALTAVVLKTDAGGAYSETGQNVDVLFTTASVPAADLSVNQAAIAEALGAALPAGGIVVLNDAVMAAMAASVDPALLNQLSPEPYDSFTAFSFEVARIFGGLIDSRVRGLRDGGSGIGTPGLFASDRRDPVLIADTSGTPGGVARPKAPGDYSNGIGPRPSGWSVWASGIGSGLWLDQSAGNLGYSGWTAGGAAGVDLRLAKGFVVGVLAGGSRSTIDFDGVSGDGDMDSVTTGVYAAWVGKRLFANTAFTYTKNWVEADRNITAMGTTANGKTEGDQYAVHATVGVGFRLKRLSIEASGGVDWVTLNQKGFTETGAGALNLTVDSRSDDSLRLRAGIRLATVVRVRPGFVLVPSARVGYARELMDTTRPITASLAGVGGAFTVTGDEGGRDFVTYGGGVQAKWSQGLTLYFDYAGEWATDRTASTFSGGVKVSW